VDAGERQDVRDNLVMAEQAMTESLRGRQPFVYQLHQDDVNRWLAARREIYPLIDELAPQALGEPFIRFDAGRITMAGRIQYGGASVVASLDVVPAMEDDAIVLRASRIRCGSLPVPIDLHEFGLDGDVNFDAEEAWPGSPPIIGNAEAGLRIGRRAWWKNGGVEYVVRDVKVEPGVLKLEIEPLGPHYVEDRRQD
jgi:hypothetical protein